MIVSDTRKFVFIHNPKCAGTTVRRALMPFDTTGDFFWLFHAVDGREIDKAHLPMALLKRLFPEYFARLETHFVFMFTRDPYARAISAFNEVRWRFLPDSDPAQDLMADREGYVAMLNDFICAIEDEWLEGRTPGYSHFIRQRDMACLGHELMADCVMKIEDLPQAYARLDVFDPELRVRIMDAPRQNVRTLPVDPGEVLSAAAIRKINTLYRDDFALFDYPMR